MRRVQVGPGTNTHSAKYDPGKFAPASSTSGFRRTNNASGPQSSKGDYTSTQDIGKQMPSGTGTGTGYRRIVNASGPQSGEKTNHTLDPGHSQFLAKGGVKGIEEGDQQTTENTYNNNENTSNTESNDNNEEVIEEVIEEVVEEIEEVVEDN